MTAVQERAAPAQAPRRIPRAALVGGLLRDVDSLVKVAEKLRAAGATEDLIGFAIPLGDDPAEPDLLRRLLQNRKRGFSLVRFLMTAIDPHAPAPDYRQRIAGQNSDLAMPVLGKMARWFVGVKVFRIPSIPVGDPQDPGAGGVWVLGHPNHAAALAGMEGAARGGALGALATIGVKEPYVAAMAPGIFGGEIAVTTCETDEGRAKRDEKLLRKHCAEIVFSGEPVTSPRRVQA